jgi:hypothetical protein
MVAREAVFHVGPFIAELEEEGAAAGGVGDGVGGRSIHVRRAASNGKGEAPLGRVEMGSAAECELDLVTEGRGRGGVIEGPGHRLAAGLLHLLALGGEEVAVGVKGGIDVPGEQGEKFVVHQELPLGATEVDDLFRRRRGGGAGGCSGAPGARRSGGLRRVPITVRVDAGGAGGLLGRRRGVGGHRGGHVDSDHSREAVEVGLASRSIRARGRYGVEGAERRKERCAE